MAAVAAVAIYGMNHFLPKLHRLVQRLILAPTCSVLLIPYGIYIVCYPPAFSLEVDGDQVRYQFRDSAIGVEFLALNNGRNEGLE